MDLSRLLTQYPDDSQIMGRLGFVHYELREFDGARNLLARAVQLDPESELWSIGLFHCLWKLGETDQAFDEVRRFLRVRPDSLEFRRLIKEMNAEFKSKGWLD
jgi:tetratricopeptide (TPR) repeat protein